MNIKDITVLILTFNEEKNIRKTLDALHWAEHIVIIDSNSTDETRNIISEYPKPKVILRKFESFADQCNFGLSVIETPWVLSIDADYVVSDLFFSEVSNISLDHDIVGFLVGFKYAVHGINIFGSLYPPRCVLYRREGVYYVNEGHAHRLVTEGRVEKLQSTICHDDRKELSRWFKSQTTYASIEAEYLLNAPREKLSFVDRLRLLGWFTPMVVFFYTLIWKGCFLSGHAGWHYVMQRTIAEAIIALEVLDRRIIARTEAKK